MPMSFKPIKALERSNGPKLERKQLKVMAAHAINLGQIEHAELADEYNAKMHALGDALRDILIPLNADINKAYDIFEITNGPAGRKRQAAEEQAQWEYEQAVAAAQADRAAKIDLARIEYEGATAKARGICSNAVRDNMATGKAATQKYTKERDALIAEFKSKQHVIVKKMRSKGVV